MRRVALLIETSRTYGRDLLRGVKRYAQEHGPWSLFVEIRDLETMPPVWLRNWDGDGILTRSGSSAIAASVKRAGVPAVELRSTRRGSTFPFVGVDNTVVASMVADHFLERGFRHFGVFALDAEPFFIERRQSFVDYLQARGYLLPQTVFAVGKPLIRGVDNQCILPLARFFERFDQLSYSLIDGHHALVDLLHPLRMRLTRFGHNYLAAIVLFPSLTISQIARLAGSGTEDVDR
jgi:hypothetical protein